MLLRLTFPTDTCRKDCSSKSFLPLPKEYAFLARLVKLPILLLLNGQALFSKATLGLHYADDLVHLICICIYSQPEKNLVLNNI
jgi:hypothetical protein